MKYLTKLFVVSFFALLASNACAETLANCSGESGQAYYPESTLVKGKEAGFVKDDVTNGLTTLTFNDRGEFDVLFKDSSGKIQSSRDGNGVVELIAFGDDNITIIIRYLFETTEIFDFYKLPNKKIEYSHTVVKPYNTLLPKAAVYIGECSMLNVKPITDWLKVNTNNK